MTTLIAKGFSGSFGTTLSCSMFFCHFLCEDSLAMEQVTQNSWIGSILGDFQDLTGRSPG